jgi:hypothetical protein
MRSRPLDLLTADNVATLRANFRHFTKAACLTLQVLVLGILDCIGIPTAEPARPAAVPEVHAGAFAIDITPENFPVIVNGEILGRETSKVTDRLHARAIVLESGTSRFAICVVDSLTIGRELLDEAKDIASKHTGIPTNRMLISATHTHSAPSVMGCLGTEVDWPYAWFLTRKIAEAIQCANERLQPARIGWGAAPAWGFTQCRRWIFDAEHPQMDPFGERTARANMHPGYNNSHVISPSGPVDPEVGILSIETRAGSPMALLASFSMHYLGATPLSADYFGEFASGLGRALGVDSNHFVGIMAQGTSGDAHWMDYSQQRQEKPRDYAQKLIQIVAQASRNIPHHSHVPIHMAESKLTLQRRMPDAARLSWAETIASSLGSRPPRTTQQVYAREQLFVAAEPEREIKLQALRIGGLCITALPIEAFAITGLKLKAESPAEVTFHIGLANGSEGYAPPPEQHSLGGYTTWLARTASLEVAAEPKIVESVLKLLESVTGRPRRPSADPPSRYQDAVLRDTPQAFWRLNDLSGPVPREPFSIHKAVFEDGVVFGLPGAQRSGGAVSEPPELHSAFQQSGTNRAVHFAGGRMKVSLQSLGKDYTVEFWVWNGLQQTLRPVAGWLFSRRQLGGPEAGGEHLGIAGAGGGLQAGRILLSSSGMAGDALYGSTVLSARRWHHVVMTRDKGAVKVYVDGKMEIFKPNATDAPQPVQTVFFGGKHDGADGLEGRIDEIAVYNFPLSPEQIAAHFNAAQQEPVPNAAQRASSMRE